MSSSIVSHRISNTCSLLSIIARWLWEFCGNRVPHALAAILADYWRACDIAVRDYCGTSKSKRTSRPITDRSSAPEETIGTTEADIPGVLHRGLLVIVSPEAGNPTESPGYCCAWSLPVDFR
jgi:hypothetical protein